MRKIIKLTPEMLTWPVDPAIMHDVVEECHDVMLDRSNTPRDRMTAAKNLILMSAHNRAIWQHDKAESEPLVIRIEEVQRGVITAPSPPACIPGGGMGV